MNYSFEYLDIILLAMIAGFIFLRLRGILGKRSGYEEDISNSFPHEMPEMKTAEKPNYKTFDESAKKIMRKAIGKIVTVPQALAFPISPQSIRVSSYNKPVQMVLLGNSYDQFEKWQNKIMHELRKNKNCVKIKH